MKILDFRVKCSYRDFIRGMVKNPFNPIIYKIGFFGVGEYSKKNNKKIYQCWQDMMKRAYDSKYKEKNPSYKDCTVCEEWHKFQNFAKWCEENHYEIEGERMELDKDIVVKRNSIYSPETCVFVPSSINKIFTKRQNKRGDFLILNACDSTAK